MHTALSRRQAALCPRSRRLARHLGLLLWVSCAWTLLPGSRPAEAAEARPCEAVESEYKVKAAFLYHFIRYTTWPAGCFEDKDAPIVVLVVGEDPFGSHLKVALGDKVVSGRRILVSHSAEVPEALGAHLIFEGGLGKAERDRLLALCKGRPVLLFGERQGFAEAGAQGNFFLEDAKVRFEINVDAVRASGLEVSSQLLKLARRVHDGKEPAR